MYKQIKVQKKTEQLPDFGKQYQQKIGNVTFYITTYDNKNAKETIQDAMKRLIENTAANLLSGNDEK